ncbi:5-methylcytosine-specific restriction endonuclease [Bacillus phage vB_Bacillus_1020A]|uniref:phage terminase small subunit P27 family n=1 Tax=Robertmurraya sp. DFI.2.37 TaxID=3031819 RepID=UPI001243EA39|nr:phage terminase small subunit P27 family [Robertmurraya sp. DFI.2.37]MDF1510815.1 phage terminase small subunit P27 family [Robertmurraya sp. DFI.2.37]QIW89295.1 5-methylcytosine-specific restriction endonuclease [Bacillus phage vB_Bacillus_1020A]
MAGRNKQPLSVIQGKGRSNHITKEEAKSRQKHEQKMRGPAENIEPPSYLTAAQKREFIEISSKLMALDIFSELDIDSLARYLDSKYQYIQLVKDLKKIKPTDTVEMPDGKKLTFANEHYPKLQRVKKSLFAECRSAAADLGLTITSRLKLVIPEPATRNELSEAERRFGGRL